MTDPRTQLATLRAMREAVTDTTQRAALDAAITALEATIPTQSYAVAISESVPTSAVVANEGYRNNRCYGQRQKNDARLLTDYLCHLYDRCDRLPLPGVRKRKAADSAVTISLERVYTQLATTDLVVREVYAGAALQQFDARAYMEQHVWARVLPGQQRLELRLSPEAQMSDIFWKHRARSVDALNAPPNRRPQERRSLDALSSADLSQLARNRQQLTFLGPQLVTEAIVQHPRLVLLGEPGSGKSTTLRYLALTLAKAGLDSNVDLDERLFGWTALGAARRLLPMVLPLQLFARWLAVQPERPISAADLWGFIGDHLEDSGRREGLAAAVYTELEAGRVLLLLDGLDAALSVDIRRRVLQAIQAFAREYPQCRCVVTCQTQAYAGEQNREWQLSNWSTATLANWTLGQMKHFVQSWYAAVAESNRIPLAQRDTWTATLQQAIETHADWQRLGTRPLLLTMMAQVQMNDSHLPEEQVQLYSRCVDLLLDQWELTAEDSVVSGTLMDYIGMSNTDIRVLHPLLQTAAFAAHESGSLERNTLYKLIANELEQQGHTNPRYGAKQFLAYIDVRAGLLQAGATNDTYIFPYPAIQEYLAGLELVRDIDFMQRMMQRRIDDRWRVPIILGMGHLVNKGSLAMPYQLLNELLLSAGRTPERYQRDLLFAAEIAEHVGWSRLERGRATFAKLRRDLADALAHVATGTVLPASERVRAGDYLCTLGEPRPVITELPPPMARIEGDAFQMGDGQEQHTVTVATFELARYPITNAQYALFIADDGYNPAAPWWDKAGTVWQRCATKRLPKWWNHARFGQARPNHPVVGISWYEALAFCRWLTQHPDYNPEGAIYRLPTEAEWEFAARDKAGRTYPWGDAAPDDEHANFGQRYRGTTRVGCFLRGATPEGVYDMAGSVWEWTCSEYREYPYDPDDGREDLDDLTEKYFTVRGGSWYNHSGILRAAIRLYYPPDFRYYFIGFRLVRHRAVQ
ncbi:MAG: SUMF1/EgtB/PvdO family nonheme iron enzyme [Chloroflexales bacterium]|nr:SUMF1/EgtB/PvdO family nonheme iron enzyme [Chloroflexales bacterium]